MLANNLFKKSLGQCIHDDFVPLKIYVGKKILYMSKNFVNFTFDFFPSYGFLFLNKRKKVILDI